MNNKKVFIVVALSLAMFTCLLYFLSNTYALENVTTGEGGDGTGETGESGTDEGGNENSECPNCEVGNGDDILPPSGDETPPPSGDETPPPSGGETPPPSGGETPSSGGDDTECRAVIGSKCNYNGVPGIVQSDCSCQPSSDGGDDDETDPTPSPSPSANNTGSTSTADCTFGQPVQNAGGGFAAEINCSPGTTTQQKQDACEDHPGWYYRGGKCYQSGTIKVVNTNDEYNWITPLSEGVCPDGYVWNSTLRLCLDRICDCDNGDCGETDLVVKSGDGYDVPVNPTSSDYVSESGDQCFVCNVGSSKSYVMANSAARAATLSGGNSCQLTYASNCSSSSSTLNCYACKRNNTDIYAKAYSSAEAAQITGGSNCKVTSMNTCDAGGDNVVDNPKTGTTAMIIAAWLIGLFTLVYACWFFNKSRELNNNNGV